MKMNEIQISRILDQARALVEEEKYLHAAQVYLRLIHSEPRFILPYLELSGLYAELKQIPAAIRLLQRAQHWMPGNSEIIFHLGNLHLQGGNYQIALELFETLAGKRIPQVHFNEGVAYFYLNDFHRAELQFRLALKYDPAFPKIHESIGELLIKRGAFDEAIDHLKRGLESDPYSAVIHSLLGMAYRNKSDWKKAHEQFVLAVDMDPGDAASWHQCGDTLIMLRRYGEAEPYLRKAIELRPNFVEALVSLGNLLSLSGKSDLAQECLERARAIDPVQLREASARWNIRPTGRRHAKK